MVAALIGVGVWKGLIELGYSEVPENAPFARFASARVFSLLLWNVSYIGLQIVLNYHAAMLDVAEAREAARAVAVINGYRTKDLNFRTFLNEALVEYRTLFDLAERYSYLAANSYDYKTGLLGTPQGQAVINRLVASRSFGDLTGGKPQAPTSTLGDAGLACTMAQLNADFAVVGVALLGNKGMVDGESTQDGALSARPYAYLIPCGSDFMRMPMGDTGDIRSWQVVDQPLPLPYNLGASDFNTTQFLGPNDTFAERPWVTRKH